MRSSDSRSTRAALRPALLLLVVLGAGPALAISQVPGPIEIGPSWGKAGAGGAASLYTTITNRGVLADRLTGGRCSGFGDATLTGLNPSTQGDNTDEKGIFIPPGARIGLDPASAHLSLADAHRPVQDGALIPCTLDFVHSGQRIVVFRVGEPGRAVSEP